MGNIGFQYDYEYMWQLAKGHESFGGLNLVWDMTDGLTKEQWIKRQKRRFDGVPEMITLNSGKILMPKCGVL